MSAGCVQCAPGEWQCGSDTTELCAGAAGWTPAGAICLQLFVRKHPKTGNCLVRVELKPLSECGGSQVVTGEPPLSVYATTPTVAKRKRGGAKKK